MLSSQTKFAYAGDATAAEVVRNSMREANLSEKDIMEFSQSDLSAMYKGGYKSARLILNAQRAGLEKCLVPALVDTLVTVLDGQRSELWLETFPNDNSRIFVSHGGYSYVV